MKFQPDHLPGVNRIVRFDGDRLQVEAQAFEHSVLVPWVGAVRPWRPSRPSDLVEADFEAALEWQPDLVIFGSGAQLKFVAPALYKSLIARRIGIETMDSGAACRTYNVLASEGRRVVAAVLMGTGHPL